MSLEIKTASFEPIRNTYAHIARRFGDKPATRYQEATYDAQASTNFHYRPLWNPDKTLNDKSHTKIEMVDWYTLKDPRQFYYGAYVQNRAKMQEGAETNYGFFEKRDLQANLTETVKTKIILALLPLRHVEQTANLNLMYGSAYGYGTTITQACLYGGMDRLGMAQYLSRIGLLIDGNSSESLKQAKAYWMTHSAWQPLRALCEKLLIQKDWVELFIAQTLVLDSVMTVVQYQQFDTWLVEHDGRDIAMLTEFMQECLKDLANWSDSVLKTIITESEANKILCQEWLNTWKTTIIQAYQPLISEIFGQDNLTKVNTDVDDYLAKRIKKIGLN